MVMANFRWDEVKGDAAETWYPESVPGWKAWRELVKEVSGPPLEDYRRREVFNTFLAKLDRVRLPDPPTCCLFVSHRRDDVNDAVHIASRAKQAGYEYWLDILDPTLTRLNDGSVIPSPAKDILLAAAIEIGLLNSTHVIAMHTQHSIPNTTLPKWHTQHSIGPQITLSKWIPYELGRAKARQIRSEQAACWFDQKTKPEDCGEYVYLVLHTRTDPDIDNWLNTKKGSCELSNDP
jgi:hypothetical protein